MMMAYKEDLYDAFKTTLQGQGTEPVFFHHNNLMLFKTILESANGEFSEYVIMPGKIGRDHGRQITERQTFSGRKPGRAFSGQSPGN
ncbi:MAG: hypothetical protein PHI28_05955 [Mangrovibacterium sp.]|nr:hypothetical protein [Mangrovibacterium sp.]